LPRGWREAEDLAQAGEIEAGIVRALGAGGVFIGADRNNLLDGQGDPARARSPSTMAQAETLNRSCQDRPLVRDNRRWWQGILDKGYKPERVGLAAVNETDSITERRSLD
jgi:hypothetical protein